MTAEQLIENTLSPQTISSMGTGFGGACPDRSRGLQLNDDCLQLVHRLSLRVANFSETTGLLLRELWRTGPGHKSAVAVQSILTRESGESWGSQRPLKRRFAPRSRLTPGTLPKTVGHDPDSRIRGLAATWPGSTGLCCLPADAAQWLLFAPVGPPWSAFQPSIRSSWQLLPSPWGMWRW